MTTAPDTAPALPVVSASGLTSLLRCGEAFRRRTVEREGRPPTTPQVRGTAVHRAIGSGLLMHLRSGQVAPPDLFEDVAASAIDRARHGGATLSAEEASAGLARTWGRLKDHAVRYAGAYGTLVAPTAQPVAVERRVTVADVIPGALLRGTLDHVDGPERDIRDAKTTERAPNADAADRSQQLSMYDLLETAVDGRTEPRAVSLDYLVLNKTTLAVEHKPLRSWRGPTHRTALVKRLEAGLRTIQAGTFLPANPETDWWCSERWCEFWSTCPFAMRPW